jgi:hypothetical protein
MFNISSVIVYSLVFLGDLIAFLYFLLKVYRLLCYTKITFDQMPIFNPYTWPLSLVRVITTPYFRFWSIFLPNLRLGKVSYDVSAILGLEFLSCCLSLSLQVRASLLSEAQSFAAALP